MSDHLLHGQRRHITTGGSMAFHSRDGLYFERDEYDYVTIRVKDRPAHEKVLFEVKLPPNEWASVIAAMSRTGETGESYQGALHYHTFDPADAT